MPYKAYFESASEALLIVDPFGSIIEVNPRASEMFGYGSKELEGQRVEVLLPQRLGKTHKEHRAHYFKAPRTRSMGKGLKLVDCHKDGHEFPIEVGLTSAITERGHLVIASVSDITERLALEREASRADVEVSLASAVAGIAHDLRNPLQAISALAQVMKIHLHEPPPATLEEKLDAVLRQCQHADRIVKNLSVMAKNSMKIEELLNINDLVESALLLLREQFQKNQIDIILSLETQLPPVLGHRVALERVLLNVLTNAIQALASGGTISIQSASAEQSVYLRISDNGPGIALEALDHIFDLQFTTKAEGTGLGLWLSRRILEQHQGAIEVKSEPRRTIFTIRLPIANRRTSKSIDQLNSELSTSLNPVGPRLENN